MTRSIRLGQQVQATDGPCGEVADIIIDPIEATVTHVVIEPHHQHRQARLVPIASISAGDPGRLSLALSNEQFGGMPTVCSDDFVHPGSHVHVGGDWDVGIEEISALPYWDAKSAFPPPLWTDARQATWDRIPKGECEIRRQSRVTVADGKTVGHVEGFVADGDHLVAIIVRPLLGFRRPTVAVPMWAVERIRTDRIDLELDRPAFRALDEVDVQDRQEHDSWLDTAGNLRIEAMRRLRSRIARRRR